MTPAGPRSTTSRLRPSRRRSRPSTPTQRPALRAALVQLADQDPLIAARPDEDGRPTVSLYGRVQQEVLGSTLAEEHGIEVEFSDASVLHVERPRGVGRAVLRLNTDENPYQATIGLRIEPGRTRIGSRLPRRRPGSGHAALPVQERRRLRGRDREARTPRARARPLRLGGHRLRDLAGRGGLQRRGRPAVQARADQHLVRLPQGRTDRGPPGAGPRRDARVRAGAPRLPGGADRRRGRPCSACWRGGVRSWPLRRRQASSPGSRHGWSPRVCTSCSASCRT